jgi:hypothetical protein
VAFDGPSAPAKRSKHPTLGLEWAPYVKGVLSLLQPTLPDPHSTDRLILDVPGARTFATMLHFTRPWTVDAYHSATGPCVSTRYALAASVAAFSKTLLAAFARDSMASRTVLAPIFTLSDGSRPLDTTSVTLFQPFIPCAALETNERKPFAAIARLLTALSPDRGGGGVWV